MKSKIEEGFNKYIKDSGYNKHEIIIMKLAWSHAKKECEKEKEEMLGEIIKIIKGFRLEYAMNNDEVGHYNHKLIDNIIAELRSEK